jgi:hypothetical protein
VRKILIPTILISLFSSALIGQSSIGIDIYSRYVWRGTDFGNAVALQHYLLIEGMNDKIL